MINLDILKQKKQEIIQKMHEAIQKDDPETFSEAFQELCDNIQQNVMAQAKMLVSESDTNILCQRGVRQLTSKEKEYYQKVIEAMKSNNPKQAISNLDVVMPETVIDSVFEELQTEHPLLSKIQFTPVSGLTRMMMNTNGYQKAAWGKLCADIIEELTSGFKEVDMTQDKLSAFLPVCNAMLDLGPEWLDRYVREVLYEALANGLEDGIINGTGKDMPVGMTKQVGENVTVTGGVYPDKTAVKITKFDNIQLCKQASILAINDKGQSRVVNDLIMVVNPSDYYAKILPAIQIPSPAGGYVTNLPFAVDIIQSAAVQVGKAVFGISRLYFLGAGMGNQGRILFSDHYRFLEDERVYLIKLYANGFPVDNNAFLLLDISGLQPAYYKVETIPTTSDVEDANLADLKFSGKAFNEEFAGSTTSYTVTTTDASNTITAVPQDATAEVEITFSGKAYANGSRLKWETGSNTVTVKVTDGSQSKTYTITVTKE